MVPRVAYEANLRLGEPAAKSISAMSDKYQRMTLLVSRWLPRMPARLRRQPTPPPEAFDPSVIVRPEAKELHG